MAKIKFDRFSGLIPRVPASLLPPVNATTAQNCDFAYGELRNTRGDFLIKQLANAPVSIYTDNGLTFFSWTEDTNAVRSPLANDQFNRLYYTTPTDFRVTSRTNMPSNGGAPTSSYRAGVPRPTVAPRVAVSTVSPLEGAAITATFHYEFSGTKYQEQAVGLTPVIALQKWMFTPPSSNYVAPVVNTTTGATSPVSPSQTPSQAVPVLRLTAKNPTTGAVLFDIYTSNSSLNNDFTWTLSSAKTGTSTDYTVTLSAAESDADKETRAYVYTYVNTYNEEGPPSVPATITLMPLIDAVITVTRDAQVAGYAPLKEIRVYRTASGSQVDENYYYLNAIPLLSASGTTFALTDDVSAAGLNEPLASLNSYPPDPMLVGLLSLPNGILMAWKGNELHFSDAYRPWSWPPAYVKTFGDFSIVGAIAVGSGALVTTTGKPFIISGVSPDSMTETSINIQQAGVSKWALADIGGQIIYASHDGLVAFDGGQPTLEFSSRFFTRDVWREKYATGLDSMHFAVWDGRLIVYSSARQFVPFMIGLDEARGAMTDLPALTAACSFMSPVADQCYYALSDSLYQFAGGDAVSATWTSREIVLDQPVNFGVAQVVCSGTWSVRFYADGVLKHTKTELTGAATFRLPSGFLSDRWQFSVQGTGRFRELRVAESSHELRAM